MAYQTCPQCEGKAFNQPCLCCYDTGKIDRPAPVTATDFMAAQDLPPKERQAYIKSVQRLLSLNRPETLPLWEMMGVPLD